MFYIRSVQLFATKTGEILNLAKANLFKVYAFTLKKEGKKRKKIEKTPTITLVSIFR